MFHPEVTIPLGWKAPEEGWKVVVEFGVYGRPPLCDNVACFRIHMTTPDELEWAAVAHPSELAGGELETYLRVGVEAILRYRARKAGRA